MHGGDIYSFSVELDFSANINPLGMPQAVREAVCRSAPQAEHYPDSSCRRLRGALAAQEKVKEEQLIFGNGASELIYALAGALQPGQALLAAPCFSEYEAALSLTGCRLSFYQCDPDKGFAPGMEIADQITDETDLVFLCSPGNPAGSLTERNVLLGVLEQCRLHRAVLAVDECFLGFTDAGRQLSAKPLTDEWPELFVLDAFTKLYAMPGLRLGYGITSDEALLGKIRRQLQPWNISVPAQEAGLAALGEEAYIQKTRALIRREREKLNEGLSALGFTVFDGRANYILFRAFAGLEEACLDRGILIRCCRDYRGLDETYFRVAVRLPEENERLLRVLEACRDASAFAGR